MLRYSKIVLKPNQLGNESVKDSLQHVTSSVIIESPYQSSSLLGLKGTALKDQYGPSESPPPMSLASPSWVNNFRDVYNEDRHFAKHWFWDNFNWDQQSIWIGKFNKTNNLPDNNEQINDFLKRLVDDLNKYPSIRSEMYIKFYFSRNVKTHEPEINYLLICNGRNFPEEFSGTLVNITFERYQLTESILNKDKDFKRLLNHYLNWSNFYIYYNLMEELQY